MSENVNNHPGEYEVKVLVEGELQSGSTHSDAGGGQPPSVEKPGYGLSPSGDQPDGGENYGKIRSKER